MVLMEALANGTGAGRRDRVGRRFEPWPGPGRLMNKSPGAWFGPWKRWRGRPRACAPGRPRFRSWNHRPPGQIIRTWFMAEPGGIMFNRNGRADRHGAGVRRDFLRRLMELGD